MRKFESIAQGSAHTRVAPLTSATLAQETRGAVYISGRSRMQMDVARKVARENVLRGFRMRLVGGADPKHQAAAVELMLDVVTVRPAHAQDGQESDGSTEQRTERSSGENEGKRCALAGDPRGSAAGEEINRRSNQRALRETVGARIDRVRARHGGIVLELGNAYRFSPERADDGAAPGQHADLGMIETVKLKFCDGPVKFMLLRKHPHDFVGRETLTRHIHRCPACDELPCDILSIGEKKQAV